MKIENIIKRKNLIVGLVIVFFGLIIARNIYQGQVKISDSLKDQIRELEEKENILKEIKILEERIEGYKEKFAEEDVSSLIEEITKNAGICNLRVSFIRPETKIIKENLTVQPINMELVGNYHNLGRFLALLEKNLQIKIEQIRTFKIEREEEDLRSNLFLSLISLK